jgi:2-isopropylmalate synthase
MGMENKFFCLVKYQVVVEENFSSGEEPPVEATLKVDVFRAQDHVSERVHKVAEGNGPVNAIDKALRKALADFYPEIAKVRLVDYEVRKRNGDIGTEASVEVTVTSSDGTNTWVTRAISSNSIRASLFALAESIEKELSHLFTTATA